MGCNAGILSKSGRLKSRKRMKAAFASLLVLLLQADPQQSPSIRAVSESAIVWGTDRPWAQSSTAQDPLTGRSLHRINTDDAEVSAYVSYSETTPGGWRRDSMSF